MVGLKFDFGHKMLQFSSMGGSLRAQRQGRQNYESEESAAQTYFEKQTDTFELYLRFPVYFDGESNFIGKHR